MLLIFNNHDAKLRDEDMESPESLNEINKVFDRFLKIAFSIEIKKDGELYHYMKACFLNGIIEGTILKGVDDNVSIELKKAIKKIDEKICGVSTVRMITMLENKND